MFAHTKSISGNDHPPKNTEFVWFTSCLLAFLLVLCLSLAALSRVPDPVLHQVQIGWGLFLARTGMWLPTNLGQTYQKSSADIEFFGLATLAFVLYLLAAWLVRRSQDEGRLKWIVALIWLGVILGALCLLLTPGVRQQNKERAKFVNEAYSVPHSQTSPARLFHTG